MFTDFSCAKVVTRADAAIIMLFVNKHGCFIINFWIQSESKHKVINLDIESCHLNSTANLPGYDVAFSLL